MHKAWRSSAGDGRCLGIAVKEVQFDLGRELLPVHLDQEIKHCLSTDTSMKLPCLSHPNVRSFQPSSGQIIQRRYRATEGEYYIAAWPRMVSLLGLCLILKLRSRISWMNEPFFLRWLYGARIDWLLPLFHNISS